MWASILVGLTPLILEWIKTTAWTKTQAAGAALGLALLAYVGGSYLDGAVLWPITSGLLQGFVLAVTGQQALYLLIKDTSLMRVLEAVGNTNTRAMGIK